MKKQYVTQIVVIIIAILTFQGCYAGHDDNRNTDNKIAVEVATVGSKDIPIAVSAVGTLSSFSVATLSAAEDGHVEKIYFNNGQDVKKNDVIIQLDQQKAQANLQSAKAGLKLSQLTLARYLEVKKYGGVSTQLLNKAEADVASKMAVLKSAEAALNQKRVIAPFNGTLGEIKVNVGDYITAGQPIVKLVNNDNLKVQYQIPQKYVAQLKIYQPVNVTIDGLKGKVFKGKVTFISPAVNESTRTVTVEATLNNRGGLLSPGMFAQINQIVGVDKNSIVVPEQSITASIEGDFVYRVVAGKVLSTKVVLGSRIKGFAQVKSGLKVGDVVVTAGIQKLSDGSKVRIVNAAPTPSAQGSAHP